MNSQIATVQCMYLVFGLLVHRVRLLMSVYVYIFGNLNDQVFADEPTRQLPCAYVFLEFSTLTIA